MTAGLEREVSSLVGHALGSTPGDVVFVPTVEDSSVYRLSVAGRTVYFKAKEEGDAVACEAWAYEQAERIGLPVPRVLHVDLTRESFPRQWLVMEAAKGVELHGAGLDAGRVAVAWREVGAYLRRLHDVRLQRFGWAWDASRPDPLVGEFDNWSAWILAFNGWAPPYLRRHGLLDADRLDRIERLVASHHEYLAPRDTAILVHGDPGAEHVFVDPATGRVTAFIDFEARGSEPAEDLGILAYHHRAAMPDILAGYGALPDEDLDLRILFFTLVRSAGVLIWVHEHGLDEVGECTEALLSALEELERSIGW